MLIDYKLDFAKYESYNRYKLNVWVDAIHESEKNYKDNEY